MFDLRSFGLSDILECSARMQRLGSERSSMEDAAQAIVGYLYSSLIDKQTDEPALALVRLYKTHRFDELEPDLRSFAVASSPDGQVAPNAPCLTLLATVGSEPSWNDRRLSRAHKAIPLHNSSAIAALPMIYQLTRELGFEAHEVVRPNPDLFHATAGRPGGVFYVADARDSEYVPDQNFVERYGIRSVVGFGGVLPSGYVFAVVMFARLVVSRETAEMFAALTFAAQLALLPFVERRLFESDPPDDHVSVERELRMARAEAIALGHLLDVRHDIVTEQAARLERARRDAEERAEALARSQRRLETSEATKAAILNAALDSIITMDLDGRVVDFNPAAERTFGYRTDEAVGRYLADLIVPLRFRQRHREGLRRYGLTGESPIVGKRIEIAAVGANGAEFPVELTIAAVATGDTRLFSGHVRDISDRVRAEQDLRAAGERYAEIARSLQSSLLPRELPELAGMDLASAYQPGQDGLDVGGDFYDIFQVEDERWGIVLGDVMGKGADAAATTALARHTVRAAAIGTDQPSAVLRVLNEALYRDDADRFCTATFAFIRLGRQPQLTVASGGHPPPLLRSRGRVSTLESPGRLLGPFPDWTGMQTVVDLDPGDLVLFYSDGVTEARRGDDQYGSERLATLLAATADAGSTDTVGRLVSDLASFTTASSDDIAVLAVRFGAASAAHEP